jgi:hypothetical protein
MPPVAAARLRRCAAAFDTGDAGGVRPSGMLICGSTGRSGRRSARSVPPSRGGGGARGRGAGARAAAALAAEVAGSTARHGAPTRSKAKAQGRLWIFMAGIPPQHHAARAPELAAVPARAL